MSTRSPIVWHEWPKEPLPTPKLEFARSYLVTMRRPSGDLFVQTARAWDCFRHYRGGPEVVAWAEMPEPYRPQKGENA